MERGVVYKGKGKRNNDNRRNLSCGAEFAEKYKKKSEKVLYVIKVM